MSTGTVDEARRLLRMDETQLANSTYSTRETLTELIDLLAAARTQLADAQAETERLRGQVEDWVPMIETDKPLFTTGRDGTIGISMRGARKLIGVMAAAMAKMLADAPNYVEMEAKTVGGPRYIIRIQRAEKPTPHQLRQAADARAESAESSLAACRAREAAIRQLCADWLDDDNEISMYDLVPAVLVVLGDETGTDKAEPKDDEPGGDLPACSFCGDHALHESGLIRGEFACCACAGHEQRPGSVGAQDQGSTE